MWNNRLQSTSKTSSGSKTCRQTKTTSLQHLSPFASHSSANSTDSPSATSPKTGPELPSGVRYIRQTPTPVHRPVATRQTSATVTKRRDKSPGEKNLRFADPLQCNRKHDKINNNVGNGTKPTVRARSTSRDRNLVRPVITAEPTPPEGVCKRYSSHNQKVVATSPATRQTSPIFSTVDFGGDTNRNSTSKESPTIIQNHTVEDDEEIPRIADNYVNAMTPLSNGRSNQDRQPVIKTEIKTPNGTVLKRSSAVASKVGTTGAVHRNTLSFPIPHPRDSIEQSRLSVNVNVAVGLDCNDNRMSDYDDQRYDSSSDTEFNPVDEIDWGSGNNNGFALQVAVRLRPFIHSEIISNNSVPVIEMNGNTVRVINSENEKYNRMEYGFDVCLNSTDRDLFDYADQDTVFKRMGEPLLERALEGYNVCLFAYGQTGSGKSFTMTGTDGNPGIIPRFVHELYKRIASLTEVLFAVEINYFEIYNEKIYDLLSDDKDYNKKILRIREHPQTGPYVEHLSQHTVEDYEELMKLLRCGNRRRATASTAANTDSSRSHSILTIVLSQLKNNSDERGLDMSCSCGSRINLIDLAGSERVGHSGTSGDRLKEGTLINKSLLNLGKVISKLADYSAKPSKSSHIPYRDSALTWLLKESLGGNSQTSMIATISPAKCHLEETMSTLRYAAIARQIVNYVHINEDPKTKKIRELMEIIAQLKAKQKIESTDPKELATARPTSSSEQHSIDSKVTSDESKESSFDSQFSNQNKIEKKSIATNTSFVSDRRTSTKGTDMSFSTVEQNKKKTATIATNTSFSKPSKTCSTGTETPPQPPKSPHKPKPKMVSTATEMSFREPERVNTSTNTSFIQLPSPFDLLRFKKLEEHEKQLLADIRKHKDNLYRELNRKVEDWGSLGWRAQNEEPVSGSDTISVDNYYDAEEAIENDSIKSDKTYVVSEDTVDQNYPNIDVTKQSSDKHSTNKKDKKKKKKDKDDTNDTNEWQTKDNANTQEQTNEWQPENDWNKPLEQIKEVDEDKQASDYKEDTCGDWGQQEGNASSQTKDDNQGNYWSVDPNDNQTEDNVTKSDETNQDWGTDTNNENKNNEWKTGEDNDWGTDNKNQSTAKSQSHDNSAGNDWGTNNNEWSEEPKKSEKHSSDKKSNKKVKNKKKDSSGHWGTDDKNQSTAKSQSSGNDWGTDNNQWSEEPKKSEKQSSDKKSNKKDKNEKKDNSDEWGTEDNTKTEDYWDNQTSEQNNDNTENQWGDWGATDSANTPEDNPEDNGNWDEENNDDNNQTQADESQFDWGTDTTNTTVIDTNNVKKESEDVDEDNW